MRRTSVRVSIRACPEDGLVVPPDEGADDRGRGGPGHVVEVAGGVGEPGVAHQPHQDVVQDRGGRDDRRDQSAADTGEQDVAEPERIPLGPRRRAKPVEKPHRGADHEGHGPAQHLVVAGEDALASREEQGPQRATEEAGQARRRRHQAHEGAGQVVQPRVARRDQSQVEPPVGAPDRAPHHEARERAAVVRPDVHRPREGLVERNHRHAQGRESGSSVVEGPAEGRGLGGVVGEPTARPERQPHVEGHADHREGQAAGQLGVVGRHQGSLVEQPAQQTRQARGDHDQQAVEEQVLEEAADDVTLGGHFVAASGRFANSEDRQRDQDNEENDADYHFTSPSHV